MTTIAEVTLWGRTIGALTLADNVDTAQFQYTPDFADSNINVAPLTMPLSNRVYIFPELPKSTFGGLPGMIADSLPDKFGNAIIDLWLASHGRQPNSMNALERLCYVGT